MATDPLAVGRRHDLQSLSEQVRELLQALNLGGAARNQNNKNVPARYQIYPFRSLTTTLAALPAPSDAGAGARAFITDSSVSLADGLGQPAVADGSSSATVPVYCDGTDWIVG